MQKPEGDVVITGGNKKRGAEMRKIHNFILSHFEGTLISIIIVGILAIAFLVHYKFSFLNFFFLPVILSGYYLGKKKAALTAIFCVLLIVCYLLYQRLLSGSATGLLFDEIINLVVWGSFLILTGIVMGAVSEQREIRLKNLSQAYIGVLEILMKYLEVADEVKPHSLRVSLLAGKIAKEMGLDKSEVEDIKSAALLHEIEALRSGLSLFDDVSDFMETGVKISKSPLTDKEKVLLKTTVALVKEIEPILAGYFHHYVEDANKLDKDLNEIPIGSSIIALADLYDRVIHQAVLPPNLQEYDSLDKIEKLSGLTFQMPVVRALKQIVSSP